MPETPPKQRRIAGLNTERVALYSLLAIVLLLGFVAVFGGLRLLCEGGFSWGEFWVAVGSSLIIAGVLGLAVDRFLKERLFDEVNRRISESLHVFETQAFDLVAFGQLPAALQNAVRTEVMTAPVIEEDVAYDYQFEKAPGDTTDVLRATITTSVMYMNVTGNREDFDIRHPVRALYAEHANMGFADHGPDSVELEPRPGGTELPLHLDRVNTWLNVSTQGNILWFTLRATLEPHAWVKVKFKDIRYVQTEDWDDFDAINPTINMVVTAGATDVRLKFTGEPDLPLRGSFREKSGDEHEWRVVGAMLPGQGIQVSWEPVKEVDGTGESGPPDPTAGERVDASLVGEGDS